MRRSLRFAVGWLAAAVAAVGISWTVIRDAVDPGWLSDVAGGSGGPAAASAPAVVGEPTARTAPGDGASSVPSASGPGTGPAASPPTRTGPGATASGPATASTARTSAPAAAPSTRRAGSGAATSAPATAPGAPTGGGAATQASSSGIRSYAVTGGRVLLRLTDTSAQLVSATPDDGYRVQSWENEGWLRVDFSLGGTTRSSVFATWNGTPPTVTTTHY